MKYLPFVDGLRAVAVLSVVLFHAGMTRLSGGYVGVDVFFVISGFLITSIILEELDKGIFSLRNFWLKRARRILPALFVVMAVTLWAFSFVYFPDDYRSVAQSTIAQLAFFSNIFFWAQSGYFDDAAQLKPLLHTWSLSVEEQFYFFFPLLLMFLRNFFKNHAFVVIGGVCILSLAASIYWTDLAKDFAFFMPFTRLWELCIGALVALVVVHDIKISFSGLRQIISFKIYGVSVKVIAYEIISIVGLYLIYSAITSFDENTKFPSYRALIPCGGTALFIWANCQYKTWSGKLIANPVFIFIGLISYSLYLWHWPILLYAWSYYEGSVPMLVSVFCVGLSFTLACLSYYAIEQPVRCKQIWPTTKSLVRSVMIIITLLMSTSAIVIWTKGWSKRYSPYEIKLIEFLNYDFKEFYLEGKCFLLDRQNYQDFDQSCAKAAKRRVLLWGDSHAAHLYYGLNEVLKDPLTVWTKSGCPPLFPDKELDNPPALSSQSCARTNDWVQGQIKSQKFDVIIIAANWTGYINHEPSWKILKKTVEYLNQHASRVIVIGSAPRWEKPLPYMLLHHEKNGMRPDKFVSKALSLSRQADRKLTETIGNMALFAPILQAACDKKDICRVWADKGNTIPMQVDSVHLSAQGGQVLVEALKETLQ